MRVGNVEHYLSVLKEASAPVVRDPRLRMESDGGVEMYYAPFDYINPHARIVLVGITPGPTQMVNGNNAARRALLAGMSNLDAIRQAKETGAFSGEPMRSNLAKQLDHWGVHKWLGIPSSEKLFADSRELVHTTSLLRYPVFVDGHDYRGTPDMTKHPLLRAYLQTCFVREVAELPNALFFALGPQVQRVMDWLVREGKLDPDRLIRGLLHPSPNCTYRITYLTGNRTGPVPHATNPVPYDQGRRAFISRYQAV